jgi:hypothetical protein
MTLVDLISVLLKKPFGNKKQIGLGTKIWDGVTNPIDLSYYLMNMKGDDMYGSNPTDLIMTG